MLLVPFLVGVTRFIPTLAQGMNAISFWVILLMGIVYWAMIKNVSGGSMVRWKARQLLNTQRETEVLYPHSVVTNFALEGSEAIGRYSDGIALNEIFDSGPFIDRVSDGLVTFLEYSDEDKEFLGWTGKSKSHWNYTKDSEALMKEIENEFLNQRQIYEK